MTGIVGVRLGEIAVPRTANSKGFVWHRKKYEPYYLNRESKYPITNVEMNLNFTSSKVR